ncbi:uncharacterized protein BXZ73DRAFT_52132 [Epithele typhae]|uniref:uncharacterized protein n=1 Tax=Epithele typhae TaxID=378194 RepID=UPI002008965D|nr:uncharacterized protein BXZ73DRAFT_52132 [Epithele typhae]KAH9920499.1 hypothetical protein BXZ73DRAFT_52132 [Epithele typhae]
MEKGLQKFRASSGHVACFGHVVQLVGRGLLDQFDPEKKKPGEGEDAATEEDEDAEDGDDEDDEDEEEDTEDGLEGIMDEVEWVDDMSGMTPGELRDFRSNLRPVRLMLTKLRRLAATIRKSTTILLPAWKKQLELLNQDILMLKQDVRTRWCSTHDMLKRAVRLKKAIKSFCEADNDLHPLDLEKYQLSKREWSIAEQLLEVLKVCVSCSHTFLLRSDHLSAYSHCHVVSLIFPFRCLPYPCLF